MSVVKWLHTLRAFKNWWRREDGVAAIEAALLFPMLITLMLGAYDVGNGIILNGRTITASQVTADLLCRNKTASSSDVDNAIAGAQLVYQPYTLQQFGIDVVSVQFDSKRNPQILWRQTRLMTANDAAINSLAGIGDPGEGMIVVTVQYTYVPLFAKYFTSAIPMREVAYARGRRSQTVTWAG